ncbi:MAG: Nif11-like leader peptide family natural product precursor [Xenococcaceae cyanobacterium MO_207.B15]|nr:Nif11-like leader peptide family natural product precursor [Xenococcaceae cyanobacterium MO_207.B15]
MSREHVKAFYERLAKDETFKAQIEGAESKQECSQIIQEAGYDFTQEEFEEFTAQLLDSDDAENSFDELSEKTLEAVFGGIRLIPIQIYGVVISE